MQLKINAPIIAAETSPTVDLKYNKPVINEMATNKLDPAVIPSIDGPASGLLK